jgi:hypothetical protein
MSDPRKGGLRVARSIKKSANQFGVPVAVSPSDSGVDTAAAVVARGVRGGRRIVIGEAAGHVPSVTLRQLGCEVVERRAEVGAGHSSDERRNNRTRRSEGLQSDARYDRKGCGLAVPGARQFTRPLMVARSMPGGSRLGRSPTHRHCEKASARLPSAEPDEGEFHVRFGGGVAGNEPPQGVSGLLLTPLPWRAAGVRGGRSTADRRAA